MGRLTSLHADQGWLNADHIVSIHRIETNVVALLSTGQRVTICEMTSEVDADEEVERLAWLLWP